MRYLAISAALLGLLSSSAQAGVFTDDLSRCLVKKSSATDRNALMAWMFSAISSDPALQKFTTLNRAKRDDIAKVAAGVFDRLILVDCRAEAVAALKAEGDSAMMESFGQLGESATNQMFQSPEAQAELESLGKNFDSDKFKALGAEAGLAEKKDTK